MVWEFYAGVLCYFLITILPWLGDSTRRPHPITVEIAERCTMLDDNGKIAFVQMILWRTEKWDGVTRPRVAQWFMLKREPQILKTPNWPAVEIFATVDGRPRFIRAKAYRETIGHINLDPERMDGASFPTDRRRPYF